MPIQGYRYSCLASDLIGTYFKFPLTETDLTNINYFMDIMFTLQLVKRFDCCPLQLEIKRFQNSNDHLNILC